MIYLLILLSISINSFATSELCDFLNEGTISALTETQVPNCLTEDNIYNETDMAVNNTIGTKPICDTCRPQFNAKSAISEKERKAIRKKAYLDSMYSEFEKAMVSLVGEAISLRQMYSTGSTFSDSIKACSATDLTAKMSGCDEETKKLFAEKNYNGRMANEIAATLDSSSGIQGILDRSSNSNQCPITDQAIINLTPRLLEESISFSDIQRFASLTNVNEADLLLQLGGNLENQIKGHPILRNLVKTPSKFIGFFKDIKNQSNAQNFKNKLRESIYNSTNGNLVDSDLARRCSTAISKFTSKICSPKYRDGAIKLGPMTDLNRYLNEWQPTEPAKMDEELFARNVAALEFCEEPNRNDLSLSSDTREINGWMTQNDINNTLKGFAGDKHRRDFGTPKASICRFLPATTCEGDSPDCRLFRIYQESIRSKSAWSNLASNPDKNVDTLLRSFITNSPQIPASTREVLVREGILPQANGQFVERPEVPERKSDYLANVSNGTITPNTNSTPVPVQAATTSNRNRQQQSSQATIFQPQNGSTAIPEQQVAANTADDDSEALRNFQDGLEERRRRAASVQPTNQTNRPIAQSNRRTASREDSSERNSVLSSAAEFAPTQQVGSPGQVFNNGLPAPTQGHASLGRDTSRRGLAERQRNAALADMSGARSNPTALAGTGRGPASVDGQQVSGDATVALTIAGDIRANLERVLNSDGSDGANLRSMIQNKRPFKFELNNSLFDVQINNGTYSVSFRSGDNSRGPTLASTLQGLFNNSLRSPSSDRNATLGDLQNTVRN